MGIKPNWTADEVEYLEDKWGQLSIKGIANRLGRSVQAVKLKAGKLGLGDNRTCVDGITLSQLSVELKTYYGILREWVREHDFPAKPRVLAESRTCLVIRYQDFWKWAESHKHIVNLSRLEPNILGPEPEWAKEKRELDKRSYEKRFKRPWTAQEDMKLRSLVNAHRYDYPTVAKELGRSEAAIKRRLYDLGIKAQPIRRDRHVKYTKAEVQQLVDMYHKGYGYNTMAEKLGKSALGIRGKLERMGYKFKRMEAVNK
ncbi:Myb-like DNA-binding domain-containing protein [Alicyclobacillus dauci]|uniref:SANT/Myb-like DNA-binding domain-containing protein n=1 Tax=Alicyclobacillus dauci TaxID=1475485 RepID=A0ABY6YX48_9BACL|nr:Myb-like DNA-binding domain-containing protein [Alicyclobacillus dauci]WAH35020.1 SANT/Myb-like DNA-binding domain-containing protein [Alicyclobacillus dauci]